MKQMTTGASNDFEVATNMAYSMVARWGLSDALGTRVYAESETEMMTGQKKRMSNQTANLIDEEVKRILDEQYNRAKTILTENNSKVEAMAKALTDWETIDSVQIADIMAGNEPTPPADLPTPRKKNDSSSGDDEPKRPAAKPQMDNPANES